MFVRHPGDPVCPVCVGGGSHDGVVSLVVVGRFSRLGFPLEFRCVGGEVMPVVDDGSLEPLSFCDDREVFDYLDAFRL